MSKIIVIFMAFIFSISALNAGIVYVPSNASDNAKTSVVSVPQNSQASSNAAVKKMSKGKLFMKLFKNKLERVFKQAKKYGDKSKVAAALLALFLGNFGVHDFYLGNKRNGFIKLGLTLVGLALMIIGVASVATTSTVTGLAALPALAIIGYVIILGVSIWAFVDFIRILTGSYEPVDGSYSN